MRQDERGQGEKKRGAADLCAGHVVVRRSQPHCGDAPSSRRVARPNLWPRHLRLFMRCLLMCVAVASAQHGVSFNTPDGYTLQADQYGKGSRWVVLVYGGRV